MMSVSDNEKIDSVVGGRRDGDNISVMHSVDKNEMQPIMEKYVGVSKISIPPSEENPFFVKTEKDDVASSSLGAMDTANPPETPQPPPVVIQSDGVQLVGSVVNVLTDAEELVPVQIQPTYPAAHPLPDVTADVDHPEKVGEIVPITIQPTYPLSFNTSDVSRAENVVIPAYPVAHNTPVQAAALEEKVSVVQITPDTARYGTTIADGSVSGSEVSSSLGEVLYPAAHPLPAANIIDHENMKDVPLHPGDQTLGNHATTGQPDFFITIQERNTSRRRGVILTIVLLVSLILAVAAWGVYEFLIKQQDE